MNIQLNFNPAKIIKFLAVIICFLLLAHVAGQFSVFYLDHNEVFGLIPLFDLNEEQNFPTLYSTLALLLCSALFSIIAYAKKRNRSVYFLQWAGLAGIFFFLFIDDFVGIHELLNIPVRKVLNTSDFFHYAWVIPYIVFVLAVFFTYIKFLLHLPRKTRWLFFTAGFIFVAGSIGIEMIIGHWVQLGLRKSISVSILITLEEFFELIGVVVLIYALLSYIKSEYKKLTITISLQEGSKDLNTK